MQLIASDFCLGQIAPDEEWVIELGSVESLGSGIWVD